MSFGADSMALPEPFQVGARPVPQAESVPQRAVSSAVPASSGQAEHAHDAPLPAAVRQNALRPVQVSERLAAALGGLQSH